MYSAHTSTDEGGDKQVSNQIPGIVGVGEFII